MLKRANGFSPLICIHLRRLASSKSNGWFDTFSHGNAADNFVIVKTTYLNSKTQKTAAEFRTIGLSGMFQEAKSQS